MSDGWKLVTEKGVRWLWRREGEVEHFLDPSEGHSTRTLTRTTARPAVRDYLKPKREPWRIP
jgi:hypothetical protein